MVNLLSDVRPVATPMTVSVRNFEFETEIGRIGERPTEVSFRGEVEPAEVDFVIARYERGDSRRGAPPRMFDRRYDGRQMGMPSP